MQKIEININNDTLKGMEIKRNTVFTLKSEQPLTEYQYKLMNVTIKDIIYGQTRFRPEIIILPYGVDLEILPDIEIISMITKLKDIMDKRAEAC